MDVFDRVQIDNISPQLKSKALNSINLIKVKRNVDIKGENVLKGSSGHVISIK